MKVFAGVVTTILVMLYPIAIWVGLSYFGPRTVGLWIVLLLVPTLALRFRRARREDVLAAVRVPLIVLVVVGSGIVLDDERFVLAMPVVINLALALTFGASLWSTPIIERFARMQHPEEGLDEGQVLHCRQVTRVWVGFFVLNASIAGGLALAAPVSYWATYNGGIAYGAMGLLFALEYIVRAYRFRRYGRGLHDRLLSRIFPAPRP